MEHRHEKEEGSWAGAVIQRIELLGGTLEIPYWSAWIHFHLPENVPERQQMVAPVVEIPAIMCQTQMEC